MSALNFRREIAATMDQAIERTTAALQSEGFGILTQINFHQKVREKLGKVSIEFAKPSAIMGIVGDSNLAEMAKEADASLQRALEKI